jgi:hypothetical protein
MRQLGRRAVWSDISYRRGRKGPDDPGGAYAPHLLTIEEEDTECACLADQSAAADAQPASAALRATIPKLRMINSPFLPEGIEA